MQKEPLESADAPADDLRPEYDFDYTKARPNRFYNPDTAARVVLEPDIARAFPTAESVNRALREVLERAAFPADAPRP